MSFEITTAYVQQYGTNVELMLQQRGSKLREYVTEGEGFVGKAARPVDQIGPTEAKRKTTRHSDTPLISTPHDARWIYPEDYEWADLVDKEDKLRTLIDPTSAYAINAAYALGRSIDRMIIRAALGNARTGEDGDVVVGFPAAENTMESLNRGLTVAKIRKLRTHFMKNEIDMDNDQLVIVVTAKQIEDMLGYVEVTSVDYNTVKALVDGKVDTFLGFKFVQTELLPFDADGNRTVIAWAKSGMRFGMWGSIEPKIDPRPDKSYSVQVYLRGTFGATRTDEKKVFALACDEQPISQSTALAAGSITG
ncbi:MAG: phage capsid protein [Candidatus Thiodiazotropha endolucinida]|nr:phage capsid protein [Candidatus Thiodiazotropha taylori]MCW4344836.1 phage capsid protein [Candidatus Thiodiazotropha endolucinida]